MRQEPILTGKIKLHNKGENMVKEKRIKKETIEDIKEQRQQALKKIREWTAKYRELTKKLE